MPKPTCSVHGCEAPTVARGWCNRHYRRWLHTGSPTGTRQLGGPLRHPRLADKQWLETRYVTDGLTTAAIAAEIGCAQPTVVRALRREGITARSKAPTRHGHTSRQGGSRTYYTWQSMIRRCTSPRAPFWERYGGRGIRVCDRWRTFENFLADMGERPPGTSIDRIDNDGNYEPENCRWATQRVQNRHRHRDAEGKYI